MSKYDSTLRDEFVETQVFVILRYANAYPTLSVVYRLMQFFKFLDPVIDPSCWSCITAIIRQWAIKYAICGLRTAKAMYGAYRRSELYPHSQYPRSLLRILSSKTASSSRLCFYLVMSQLRIGFDLTFVIVSS